MQGKKDTDGKLFYQACLDDLVPEDHVIRRIRSALDLKYLYTATRPYYAHDGKPSIDPVVVFKIYLLGYLFGIPSERRLMREIAVNMAYRWYLGYDLDEDLPDHSVLTKARLRFPEKVFEEFFKNVVRLCRDSGLISGSRHFIDSSIIRASAAKDSYRARLMPLNDYLARIKEVEEQDYSFKGEVDPEKMGSRRKRVGSTSKHVSQTDPEAEITVRPGKGTYPAYKAHACVDGRKRVILSITGSRSSIDDMHEVHRLLTESIFLAGRKPTYIVADSHYGGVEALKYYQDQGIETCIKPRMSDSNGGRFKNSQFVTTDDGRGLVCPNGQISYRRIKHRFRYQFRFDEVECSRCGVRLKCTDRSQGRIVSYYSGDHFEKARNIVDSPLGKKLLRQRQTVVEGIWAEAKGWHCLSRCQRRGLTAFRIQLYMTAAAINLKRLLGAGLLHGSPEALAGLPCFSSSCFLSTI
jgi:transposase